MFVSSTIVNCEAFSFERFCHFYSKRKFIKSINPDQRSRVTDWRFHQKYWRGGEKFKRKADEG